MLLFTSTKRFFISILFGISGLYGLIAGPLQGSGLYIIPIVLLTVLISVLLILPELLYFRKPACDSWKKWDGVHDSNKQQERIARANSGDVTPFKICRNSRCALFIGHSDARYRTTLTNCSCPDFKNRKVPCKHMYYLAYELNVI